MKPLDTLRKSLLPSEYKEELKDNIPEGWMILKKGAYLFAAVPFTEETKGDYGSINVKNKIKTIVTAFPIIAEKGLFLLYYGDSEKWRPDRENFTVDKTALRPVILQSVHFLDPKTNENYNIRTHWGPIKFGFCGGIIDKLEAEFEK